jgi:hypothetical protein
MNNLLGVEYFRLVKETSNKDWSQVYVKTPLKKNKVHSQGGVFGVMRLFGEDKVLQRGSVLMNSLEMEYENDDGDVLKNIFTKALSKEKNLEMCLVQILEGENEKKVIRIMVNASGFVDIVRKGKRSRLIASVSGADSSSVLKGEVMKGDRLILGVGLAGDFVKENDESLLGENLSVVGEELSSILFSKDWQESFGLLLVDVFGENSTVVLEEEKVVSPNLWQRRKSFFPINVKSQPTGNKKWPLWVAGIFLIILLASVVVGLKKSRVNAQRLKFDSLIQSVEKKKDDGLDLLSLNPSGARDLISKARDEAEMADKAIIGPYKNEWDKEMESLNMAWEKVSGETSFNEEVFFDLGLIRDGFLGDLLIYEKEKVFVLDKTKKTVVDLGVDDKKNEVVSGDASDAWMGMVVANGKILGVEKTVIVDDLGESVYEFELVIGGVSSAASFGSYIYILDDVNGEIWKLRVADDGSIGSRTRWLTDDVSGLRGGLDIGIDGDVWVAGRESVIRLRRGSKESFGLKNAPAGIEIAKIAVWSEPLEEDGFIAILDKLHGKVVIFDRTNGEYVKQWGFEEFKKASDLEFVSKNEVLVLIEGKLYKISI